MESFWEELQLCDWKNFNQNAHENIMFTQSFEHNYSLGEHGLGFSLRKLLHHVPLGFPKEQPCSLKQQMCLKFRMNITFSCEFWLKCFQLQSFNSPQGLSNDRSKAYIKNYMRWLQLLKDL
jgi:hypothetical protein